MCWNILLTARDRGLIGTLGFACLLVIPVPFTNSHRAMRSQDLALLILGRSQPTMPLSRYCYKFGEQISEQRTSQRRIDRPFVSPTAWKPFHSVLTRSGLHLEWHRCSMSLNPQPHIPLTFRRCPYIEGGQITLAVQGHARYHTINAQIINVIRPFTLSCVMVVQLCTQEPDLQGRNTILKMFDRRFAAGHRETLGIQPWTPRVEAQYQEFIRRGDASKLRQKLQADRDLWDREGDTWDVAQNEAFFDKETRLLYETEKEVYRRADRLQGRDIPRLLLDVDLISSSDTIPPGFQCPGFLLQFIPGFNLADMATHAPKEHWQDIGDEAIRIVHAIGDLGVLNKDVQRLNFIVNWDPRTKKFKVFMIDFGLATFREEVENEVEWRKLKAHEDEEGAVGKV